MLDRLGILARSEIGFIVLDAAGSLKEVEENLRFVGEHVPFITPGTLLSSLDDTYTPAEIGGQAKAVSETMSLPREA